MVWTRTATVATNGVALNAVERGDRWIFRGLYRAFAWQEGAHQLAWEHAFADDNVGDHLLVVAGDLAIVASYRTATSQTTFVALDVATGAVRWQRSLPFRPANRRNTHSMSCDGACVTCLGSNADRQFCMLRFDVKTGEVVDDRVLGSRHDVTVAVDGRTFIGGSRGVFVLQDGTLEPVCEGDVLELEPFEADLIANVRTPKQLDLIWLTSGGETRASVALERGLGLLRPAPASQGRVVVLPQFRPGLSLYDLHSGALVWTAGQEPALVGYRAVVQDGRVLAHVERGADGFVLVALRADTGELIEPPLDRVGAMQLFGARGRFVVSLLQQIDVYRWS